MDDTGPQLKKSPEVPLLGNRYRLLQPLGAGGMGTVYRAHDLLTGETIAVKRVATSARGAAISAASRLALAREFQALAGLRHPNVVAVRNYGFDTEQQPYFTMDLLPQARSIVEAGQWLTNDEKLDRLLQLLGALVYLHRRNIIHRDLKPGNVQLVGSEVKVLDFGLAAVMGKAEGISGTIPYLAPEVLRGEPASPASDLYAVGIIAFELLAGWHPFAHASHYLTQAILHEPVDFAFVDLETPLIQVLSRLLAKTPETRYHDASKVIVDLCVACGRPLPEESAATRDSFLKSAPFTGRAQELATLLGELQKALAGQGGYWLVGGESGIGKSRLLQEMQTHAMVLGATILRGQANRDYNDSYQLWRPVLRALALIAQPEAADAAILKAVVPDIGDLLGYTLSEQPPIEPLATQSRLRLAMLNLIQRGAEHQPLLLLLEDLHWCDEQSLQLLQRLNQLMPQLSVLIVGSYRHDEQPTLATKLSAMQPMLLERLNEESVAQLSEAMLGRSGRQSAFVQFLQRESEGNTFFMVEVMRTLAEETGRLDQIAEMTLPVTVFAQGIQQIVQSRLERVPLHLQPILQLSAVAGRQVDLALLTHLVPASQVDEWLEIAINAAILDRPADALHWQFSHDKLREGVLQLLTIAQQQSLHQQIGTAMEKVYSDNLQTHAAQLATHFGEARQPDKERSYSFLAGQQAVAQFDSVNALKYLNRTLQLTAHTAHSDQCAAILLREKVYHFQGNRELQSQDLATLFALAERLQEGALWAEVYVRQATYAAARSDYATAIDAAQQAIAWAEQSGESEIETRGLLGWGSVLWRQGEYQKAHTILMSALQLAQGMGLPALEAEALNDLGTICRHQGDYAQALHYYEQAHAIHRTMGDVHGEARTSLNQGVIHEYLGKYEKAQELYGKSLQLRRRLGDRRGEGRALNNLGVVADSQGNYSQAIHCYEQALQIYQEVDDPWGQGYVLNNLGFDYRCLGVYTLARDYSQQSLEIRRKIGDPEGESETLAFLGLVAHDLHELDAAWSLVQEAVALAREKCGRPQLGYALTCLGRVAETFGDWATGEATYGEALQIRHELGETNRAMESLAGLARIALSANQLQQAQTLCNTLLQHLSQESLDGTEEPFLIYLTCYQILATSADARGPTFLEMVYQRLQERAAKIEDATLRNSFLTNVLPHREIIKAWNGLSRRDG